MNDNSRHLVHVYSNFVNFVGFFGTTLDLNFCNKLNLWIHYERPNCNFFENTKNTFLDEFSSFQKSRVAPLFPMHIGRAVAIFVMASFIVFICIRD
jgi:hypothetical protein